MITASRRPRATWSDSTPRPRRRGRWRGRRRGPRPRTAGSVLGRGRRRSAGSRPGPGPAVPRPGVRVEGGLGAASGGRRRAVELGRGGAGRGDAPHHCSRSSHVSPGSETRTSSSRPRAAASAWATLDHYGDVLARAKEPRVAKKKGILWRVGGGRRVRHGTAATGRRRRRGTGAARGRAWASGQGWRRRSWGRVVEPGVDRGRPSACPTAKPAAARPTAFGTDSVSRPSSRQPTVDRGDGAERPPPRPTRGVGVPVLPSHAELRDQG